MSMPNQLPRFRTGVCEGEAENHIVQPGFEQEEKIFSCNPLLLKCTLKIDSKLILEDPVDPFHLLLFPELGSVVGKLPPPELTVLSRGITPSFKSTLVRETPFAFEKKFCAFASAEPTNGLCIACQESSSNLLRLLIDQDFSV